MVEFNLKAVFEYYNKKSLYVKQSGSVWKMSVFSPKPKVPMSVSVQADFYIPHAAKNKSNPVPQIHRNFSQSLLHHRVLGLRRGAPMFRLNVQMSSVMQNRPENNLTKTTQSTKKTVWQSLKRP